MNKKGKRLEPSQPYACQNCGHVYSGKVCNNCGEKRFDEHQLSSAHFFHQIVDFFTHFENKVLKTIWLNFTRPGYVTQQNLKGVRVRYASPVQLYLVVSIIFFLIVTKVGVTDYTPSPFDHYYFPLSQYSLFKWAAPLDQAVVDGIDSLRYEKYAAIKHHLIDLNYDTANAKGFQDIVGLHARDSFAVDNRELDILAGHESRIVFWQNFQSHVSTYSKTLIFLTLPFIAALLFLFFFRRMKMYGAALILATHFMVYNLCFFSIHALVDILPGNIFGFKNVPNLMDPFRAILFNQWTAPVSNYLFGFDFEFLNLLFWIPWLFIAFRRLFGPPWWVNLLVSYLCSRVFFFLIFGVMKKFLIAFTIWTMH